MEIIGSPVHFGDTSQLPGIEVISGKELDFSGHQLTFGQKVAPGKFAEVRPGPTDNYQPALIRKQPTTVTEKVPHDKLISAAIEQFSLLESFGVQIPPMYFVSVRGDPFRPCDFYSLNSADLHTGQSGTGILTVTRLFSCDSEFDLLATDPAGEMTCRGLLRYLEYHEHTGAGKGMLCDIFKGHQCTRAHDGVFLHDHDLRLASIRPDTVFFKEMHNYLSGWLRDISANDLPHQPSLPSLTPDPEVTTAIGPMAQVIEAVLHTITIMDEISLATTGLTEAVRHAKSDLQTALDGTKNPQSQAALARLDELVEKMQNAAAASRIATDRLWAYGPLSNNANTDNG
ncbi:MAG TPA: hypothetical protein VMR45_06060 [Patescibacteria group bacterium]|nr:hypothetical protein [Patescibacteria group bacterium]